MVYWILKNMSSAFTLIIDWWKIESNRFKNLPLCDLIVFGLEIQIKDKHLAVRPKQEAVPDSEITSLVLKTPTSQLVHAQDWMVKVLLWIDDHETAFFSQK